MLAHGCQEEKQPQYVIFEEGLHAPQGGVTDSEITISERVPLDTIIYGLYVEALTDAAARTLSFAFNLRDSRDEQWWFQTLPNAGGFVPAALVAGTIGEPFMWAQPRILRRGSTVELKIKADSGVSLCQLRVILIGERVALDRQGRLADEKMAFDARDAGYSSVVITSPLVSRNAVECTPGDEINRIFPIGSKSYDTILQEASLIVVDPIAPLTPLTDVIGEVRLRDTSISHTLMGNGRFVPFSYFGGMIADAGFASVVRPVSSRLGCEWRIRQDSAFEVDWRLLSSPTVAAVNVVMAFHGYRAPVRGRVASTQQIADRSRFLCPPGMSGNIDMPYPGGPR